MDTSRCLRDPETSMKSSVIATVILVLARLSFAQPALQSCPDLSQPGTDVFDFVVVGSGAGGGPLAARLAENGFSGMSGVRAIFTI